MSARVRFSGEPPNQMRAAPAMAESSGGQSLASALFSRPMPKTYPEVAYSMDIFTAASIGDNDVIKSQILRGIDINARNVSGWTALHYAAYLGHEATVSLFLDNSAQIDTCNARGQTALMLASACGNLSTVNLLLKRGASVDRVDISNRQALHYAGACSQNTVTDALLAMGADPNSRDQDGMTPTLEACSAAHELTLLALLGKGGDVMAKNSKGDDGAALASECPSIVQIIRQHQDFDDMGIAYGPKKKMLKVIQKYKEVGAIVVEQFDVRGTASAMPTDEIQQTAVREMTSTLRFVKEGNENIKQYALEALEKLANSSNAPQLRSLLTNIIDLTEQIAARTTRHAYK
ncbi:unnamed protein product, partial [Mesorhabditis belari]|uniref:Ankyrin repeat protein n=1 Tax=Mesorhabditis belari TaxID=2138241 RepID=A0AAF3FF35_9BILA